MGTRIKTQRTASSKQPKQSFLRVRKNLLNFCLIETQQGGDNGRPGRSCWGEDGEADSLSQRQTAKTGGQMPPWAEARTTKHSRD